MTKMGRPLKEFTDKDWKQLEEMCHIHCTQEEICSILGLCEDTLSTRIKEKYDITFSEFYRKYSAGGKMSLRRAQFNLAKKSAAMGIWLGKQYLGQREPKDGDGGAEVEDAAAIYNEMDKPNAEDQQD